jgi:hypothetical protein
VDIFYILRLVHFKFGKKAKNHHFLKEYGATLNPIIGKMYTFYGIEDMDMKLKAL